MQVIIWDGCSHFLMILNFMNYNYVVDQEIFKLNNLIMCLICPPNKRIDNYIIKVSVL